MSRSTELSVEENEALVGSLRAEIARWRAKHNKSRGGQTPLAERLGCTQPTLDAALKRGTVSARMAIDICRELLGTTLEEFRAEFGGPALAPAPPDVPWFDLQAWLSETKAVQLALKKYKDITALDLLRLRAEPARHGETDPDEVYGHIKQLRSDRPSSLPGRDLPAATVIKLAAEARARAKPSR